MQITFEQVNNWFTYHAPDEAQQQALQVVREKAKQLALCIHELVPDSADKTAAMRKLRECVMTANAAIVLRGR
jgi:hypothetical protein